MTLLEVMLCYYPQHTHSHGQIKMGESLISYQLKKENEQRVTYQNIRETLVKNDKILIIIFISIFFLLEAQQSNLKLQCPHRCCQFFEKFHPPILFPKNSAYLNIF